MCCRTQPGATEGARPCDVPKVAEAGPALGRACGSALAPPAFAEDNRAAGRGSMGGISAGLQPAGLAVAVPFTAVPEAAVWSQRREQSRGLPVGPS